MEFAALGGSGAELSPRNSNLNGNNALDDFINTTPLHVNRKMTS